MRNVEVQVDREGKLHLVVDLGKTGIPSKSGKSLVLGTTEGNKVIEWNGNRVYFGLTVYKYPSPK